MVLGQDHRSLQDCSVEECLNCGLGLVVVRLILPLLLHHHQVYITNQTATIKLCLRAFAAYDKRSNDPFLSRVVESESPGVRVLAQSRSLSFEGDSTRDSDSGPCLSHLDLCNFVAVCLTFMQFILQLKLCLYTIVHLLIEEFKNFSQVILKYTVIVSHNKS